MFKKNRLILLLFILYCCDSLWKFLHWHAYMNGLPMYGIVVALTVRFLFMGGARHSMSESQARNRITGDLALAAHGGIRLADSFTASLANSEAHTPE